MSPESCVPEKHPLRPFKKLADEALKRPSRQFAKSFGGMRKTAYRGIGPNRFLAGIVGATYNLLKITRLSPVPA